MNGELVAVWEDSWVCIWQPLFDLENIPSDIFCELYREFVPALAIKPTIEQLADTVDNREQSRDAFRAIVAADISSERKLVSFFESAYDVIDDLAGSEISKSYRELLIKFIERYSLRYQLRVPCAICPTLPGIFSSLVRDLQLAASGDAHLSMLLNDFECALQDIRADSSDGKVKTVIQKQVNLLEALGASCKGVRGSQLGAMCAEVKSWPHATVQKSLSSLYGFTSDYPGIRHAGNPGGVLKPIDLRDLISLSVVFAGFTPYLRDNFQPSAVFWGPGGVD